MALKEAGFFCLFFYLRKCITYFLKLFWAHFWFEYLPILTVKNIDVHSIVSTYICKIFIALTVFAINLTCILCTLSYNMTLSIANYETAKSKSHHVCRWQWFCRKKGRRGHFPKCPKQHKRFMYLERNSHHLFKGPSINNVITLPELLDPPTPVPSCHFATKRVQNSLNF